MDNIEPLSYPLNKSPESLATHGNRFSFEIERKKGFVEKVPSWVYKVLVSIIALSWITTYIASKNTLQELYETQKEEKPGTVKLDEIVVELSNASKYRRTMQSNIIQESNKKEALKAFGPGPHFVRFTVEFPDDETVGIFEIRLAPLNLMPHAVNTFLKQVSKKLWDKTVFWHHDGVDHVIQAAGIHYRTGETKHHHFDAMDVGALSFGEYSADMPHKRYTLGFAGRGPEFYINALDNTEVHGPGGQGHHEYEDEADPCFAEIISGFDTVNQMNAIQLKQSKEAARRKDWHDNELTHIVQVEILSQ
eukprot:CAMPEP_0194134866 /NCGR_PEP_ID=MMETSP0152-20130528/4922_1 /TAXON_ID=1049557 /ORGANISM="Thalassiothrix antarctica, Strain L6-D1" /LENGTH=305 /DNA_ID=CAMNT_0038830783 /DNA_START=165 /DNA_END=1082 /DNA_ORIENTATION=+